MTTPPNEILRQHVDTLAGAMDTNANVPVKPADVREIGTNLAMIEGREKLELLQSHMQTRLGLMDVKRAVGALSADDEDLYGALSDTSQKITEKLNQAPSAAIQE